MIRGVTVQKKAIITREQMKVPFFVVGAFYPYTWIETVGRKQGHNKKFTGKLGPYASELCHDLFRKW